jgi:ribonuclease-3
MAEFVALAAAIQRHRMNAADDPRQEQAAQRLEDVLDHRFAVPQLLREALTHASLPHGPQAEADSNERLEFLGDRVLGLAVAHLLHSRFPKETVGELARRHASLVRREALELVARRIGLPAAIRMSRGEEESGGRDNPGVLADACEAVIAALYLDGGLAAAVAFVERHWRDLIEGDATPPKDPKTALQEWLQARGQLPPVYRETTRVGPPHAPIFSVEVAISGHPPVTASGSSKRAAERAAAAILLARVLGSAPG